MITELIYLHGAGRSIIIHSAHIVSIVVTPDAITFNMSDGREIYRNTPDMREDAISALHDAGYEIE